uniref:MFSD2 lysolipid transporter B, sphingolipid n=1 Tax=Scleropages formosus TaxID=113540 RepID=A0A8C9TAV9_SCLFO
MFTHTHTHTYTHTHTHTHTLTEATCPEWGRSKPEPNPATHDARVEGTHPGQDASPSQGAPNGTRSPDPPESRHRPNPLRHRATTPPPPSDAHPDQKLSVCSKLCFAIGGIPNQIAGSATAFFLQIYLLDVAQINPFQASMVLFVGKAWGALTDPVVGFFISKSKWTKIGRLMPWMVGCTPFLTVSYFYLWYVPPFTSGRFIWYLGFYCLYQTLITCFHVPYSALTMFLSTNQKERDSATAYSRTKRRRSLIPQCPQCAIENVRDLIDMSSLKKSIPFQKGFVLVMRHGPYIILTASFLFISVAIQLVQSNFVLFCTYAVDLRDHFQNIVLTILLSAVVSIPLWQWFLERFGKKTAAFCGITWIIPFIIMLVLIPNLTVAYIVAVSSGLSVAASLLLPWSMLPDVVDDFRLANPFSKGHEAIFYSLYVFFTKFAAGISLGVSTLCLQFAGYSPRACQQHPPVVHTLKLLIGVAPVAFIATGVVILLMYPITEEVRIKNKFSLDQLRLTLYCKRIVL